ncbi:MAG: prepilin-type N-terminal cleavage/methylation domain-containing protein [Pontiella sp.]
MMNSSKPKNGFTLLEIVVSITLLALIALMISRVFTESMRAVDQGKEQVLIDETARLLLDMFEQDVSQTLIRTNVAFRINSSSAGNSLYFISTAVRRVQEGNPRDTAPMRLRIKSKESADFGLVPAFNKLVISEFNTGIGAISNLINQSDYYYPDTTPSSQSGDFWAIQGGSKKDPRSTDYTEFLTRTEGLENHASLTFLEFVANANNTSATGTDSSPPDPNDIPRFVDVAFGLVSSKNLQQAMRIYNAQGNTAAQDFLAKRERIYTRRIFMRNTGTSQLNF